MPSRVDDALIPASVIGRTLVGQLVAHDVDGALGVARAVPHGWYRCQALAEVAQHSPTHALRLRLDEAAAAARTGHDAYQQIAVLAWPLEVAIRRHDPDWAERELWCALAAAPMIEPLPSRAFALHLLWSAVWEAGNRFRAPIWDAVQQCCPPDRSWRAARLYREIAEDLQTRGGRGRAIVNAMPPGRAREKLARHMQRRFGGRPY